MQYLPNTQLGRAFSGERESCIEVPQAEKKTVATNVCCSSRQANISAFRSIQRQTRTLESGIFHIPFHLSLVRLGDRLTTRINLTERLCCDKNERH